MAANSTTTGTGQASINIQAGQTTEVSVASGQSLMVGADVASISKGEGGALILKFSNGATLIVKNYAEIAGMEKSPTVTLADGKTVELAVLVSENVNQLVSTAMEGSTETVAEANVISKPKANEDLVVKLEEGETYKFGFAMNEPVSVKNNEGQLVIAFKNGGEIIIPNYDAMKNSAHGVPEITMQDGASIPLSEFGDVLATATQLNLVEPAAGDTAGGGAGRAGGFGFQSSFTATPFNSFDPIGPINPTKLQYDVSDRRPEPEFIPTAPAPVPPTADQPNLEVVDKQVKEDGSVVLHIEASLNDIDGSEVLTVSVSGITVGWGVDTSVSGGTYDAATGTWTLTLPAGVTSFSGGPTLSPPANSDADLNNLVVTATATETVGGDTATKTAIVNVVTDAVIDAPSINAPDAQGSEDTPIPLSITVSKGGDTLDGSEVLSNITISGVPAGASLSAGTDLGGGVWSLTTAQLVGLTLTPAHNFNGNFTLTVSVTDTETNLSGAEFDTSDNAATATDTLLVSVAPVADDPAVTADDAQVKEDGSVALSINATLAAGSTATDYMVVTISGITAGWGVTASGGTFDSAAGTWTFTVPAGQNFSGGPTFSPPANSDADLNGLVVTAQQFDSSNTLLGTGSDTASIVTDAVIDAPTLVVPDVAGNEDTAIPLSITVTKGGDNLDGSEVLSNITISGVPAGATLSAGSNLGGGVWSLTTAQLAGLTITPGTHFSGNFNLTVSVTDTETNLSGTEFDLTDNTATVTDTVKVTVTPVADQPNLSVVNKQVKEDGSVALTINASLVDTDGSETLTVSISGITAGWGVNTSFSGGTYNAGTGVWTLTLPAGVTSFSGGPTLSPPANSDADLTGLVVTATATDGASLATRTATMNVVTDAVIDAPTLVVPDVTGNEDTAIPLSITVTKGGDNLDGSEVLSNITISGVPAGATLSAGSNLGGGVWSLTTAQLAGLTLTPAHNFNGNFNLMVSVTDTETNLSGGEFDLTDNTATVTDTVKVTVNPVGDDPSVSANDVQVKEDGSVQLVVNATLSSGSQPTEYMTITISGITAGWGVNTVASGGTFNSAAGTWTLTVPAGQNYAGGPVFSPPANSDVDLNGLVVTARQFDASNNLLGSATDGARIAVDAVIDAPTLVVPDVTGNEDTAIPLSITVTKGGDNLDGSEVLSNITISGVPAGATLSAGSNLGGGVWSLTTAQLAGLTITPGTHFSGNFNLTVSVTDTETNLSGTEFDLTDNTATVTDTVKVTVTPVADQPNLSVVNKQVKEDGSVALTINASLVDTDGSETLSVSISGITAGWGVNTSVSGGTYNAATGTWTLNLPAGVTSFSGGPTLSPPANSDADLTGLVVTATATDGASLATRTATMNVVTDAVIDAPTVNADDVSGEQDTAIALNISVGRGGDTLDGSEQITSIIISGIPAGSLLNHGTLLGNGDWSLSLADLSGLTLTPSAGFFGDLNLTVKVTETETNLSGGEFDLTDNSATATDTMRVIVQKDDTPEIVVPPAKVVDETNLTPGPVSVSGTVSANFFSDAPGVFSATGLASFGFGGSAKNNALTSNGLPVVVTLSGNTYVGTAGGEQVFTLQIQPNGSYTFNLTGVLDHADASNPDDVISLNFGVRATDSDGDSVTTTIVINVHDDGVTANDDNNTFIMSDSGAGSASGNVVSGLNGGSGAADDLSEDVSNKVTSVSFGSTTVAVPVTGTAQIEGDYGILTLASDGTYSYSLKPGVVMERTMETLFLTDAATGVRIEITAIETASGVEFTVKIVSGSADLNGFYLDYNGDGGPVFSVGESGNNMGGTEGFDYAKVLGTVGGADTPVTQSTFTVSGITLEDIEGSIIGIRATSAGTNGGASLKLTGDAVVTESPQDSSDVFVYTLTDADGDSDTALLTLNGVAPVFKVGKNADDVDGSTTTYQVGGGPGKIIGNGAGDVLVGDVGGSSLENVNKDYNIVLILDVSGSMAGSKLTLLKGAVNNLMTNFNSYTGGTVKVHFVTFSDQTKSEATFTVTNLAEFNSAKTFINNLVANGWTNYEDPLQDAVTWLQSTTGNKPIAGAETFTYFVSDGEPNRYMNTSGVTTSGTAARVMQEITGTYDPSGTSNDDLVSEVAILQSLSTEVIGVGISITATTLARLDVIDSTAGGALDVQNPADLSDALQGASPLNKLAGVGGDVLTAGGGDDILFGDSLFTDDLAAAHGLTTMAGAGWDVFAQLEAGLSALNPGWTRADTIAYIKANATALAEESLGSGGTPRTGGNDRLEGGSGSDMIFGQEGNDMIIGGLGDDLLSGGTGADTFLISSMGEGADTISDFNAAQGDVLDISNILTGFDPLTESLHDFVKVVNSGGDSIVQVDTTGTGTAYQTVAVLEGVTLDVDTLANNGNLIA